MLNIQKKLSALLYKTFYAHDSNAYNYYLNLKQTTKLPFKELKKMQLENLNKMLNYANKHVPYYRELFTQYDMCGKEDYIEFRSLDELNKLPFLTKDIIRREGSSLYSNEHIQRKSFDNTSGGSTGEPVLFKQDILYNDLSLANWWFIKSLRGIDPFDSEVIIWGAERDIFKGKKPFKDKIIDFLLNRIILNSFRMSEEEIKQYINILNKSEPRMVRAYAQSIYEIAKYAKAKEILVKPQHAIHTAAGNLYDYMREMIEDVFQTKVFNHYGSREIGTIATECTAHDGLHIFMNSNIIEIIDENGCPCANEEQGEIVVTSLINYSMPLIRYKIGDVGIKMNQSPCQCGCGFEKLRTISGRTVDLFTTRNGSKIDGEYFTHLLYFRPEVQQFQVIQKELGLIIYKIILKDQTIPSFESEIIEKTKLVMGENCEIEFHYVDSISLTATGKHRYTISEI